MARIKSAQGQRWFRKAKIREIERKREYLNKTNNSETRF